MDVLLVAVWLCALVFFWVKRSGGRVRRELRAFLGAEGALPVYFSGVPAWMTVDVHRGLAEFFASEGMQVRARGYGTLYQFLTGDGPCSLGQLIDRYYFGELGLPDADRCEIEEGRFEQYPDHCVFQITGGAFPLLVVRHPYRLSSSAIEAAVVGTAAASEWLEELLKRFRAWCVEHSVYRARTVTPVFHDGMCTEMRLLPRDAAPVVLEPELAETLEASFLAFWRHRDLLRDAGLGAARGLLLCGEPGTGKSTTCRYLRQQLPEHTVFVVDSAALGSVRAVFEVARKMAPALIVIEDVDLVLQSREATGGNAALKDLMNALDGLEERTDVSVVLTSNSWHFMEEAVADRPGRIDQVIFYGRPGRVQRERLLETFTGKLSVACDLGAVAQATDGFSPAQLRELVKRAVVGAVRRDGVVQDADFDQAAKAVKAATLTAVSRAHGKRGGRVVGLATTQG